MEKSEKINNNNEVTITKVSAKKNDDIKNFAESTMNEMLGWYGYESPGQEPKMPIRNSRSYSGSNDSEGESVKFTEGCGWCGKTVDENNSVISATAVFCSELCFSQSRRASFKRNKTCDWCRHARHTVSYVDFQDNAAQLQFCSDKCLNQYKMHIFCRETQAHLDLHPHVHGAESTSAGLITPDLWLKSCTSPQSPPALSTKTINSQSIPAKPLVASSVPEPPIPLLLSSSSPSVVVSRNTNKLLATDIKRNRPSRISKRFKKRCPSTVTSMMDGSNDGPQDLRVRTTPPAEDLLPNESSYNFKTSPKMDDEDPLLDNPLKPKLTPNSIRAILGNILPPPTTFVPYPVILPLPIPIPIPIPIPKMFKSNNGKDLIELKDSDTQTDTIYNNTNNNNNVIPEENNTVTIQKEAASSDEGVMNRRLLRRRKHADAKSNKVFLKHKKTLSTLP